MQKELEKRAKFEELEESRNKPVTGLEKFNIDKSKEN